MNEQEKIDQFNQDLENLLKGNSSVEGVSDSERYQAARQLAAADFSARSRARETTRVRLLARANHELPIQNKRKEMNARFSNVFRTLAFGAFLLMIVFGLGWVLSNTTPQLGVGLETTPPAEPVSMPEEPAIAFPRQPADWGSMLALMKGRLVLVDGCLRIEDPASNSSWLLIWPHDFDWQITEGIVEVLDSTGQVVARVGEGVSMGGGEAASLAGLGNNGDPMQDEVPDSCTGPYWLVGIGDVHIVELETPEGENSLQTPALEQLKNLADLWDASLLETTPIWLHLVRFGHLLQFSETIPGNDSISTPNPSITEYYCYVDSDFRIIQAVDILKDWKEGNVVETRVLRDGTWFNLTLGTSELATTQVHFRSFGSQFVSRAEDILAQGGSLEVQNITDEVGRPHVVFTTSLGDQVYEATFDSITGQLTNINIYQLSAENERVLTSTESSLEESWTELPDDVLAILDMESVPYNVAPTSGNFNPALSTLSFKWVFNEDGSAPDIYIADVYAGDQWLGRADFGEIPGGSCDRSWNGGLIALNYAQGNLETLRWFSLKDVTMYHELPGYDLHSPATFAPNDFRVAFVGCKEDDCGIFVKDLEFDGAVIKLSDGETATAPVWSPDGEYVIIWYGGFINERGITNIKVVHAETGEVLYMGDPTLDDSPLQAWDMSVMYKPFTSTQRCEAPPETISSDPILPSPDGTYTVQEGDTLAGIANQFGLSIETLLSLNGLTIDSILVVGQVLVVAPPTSQGEPDTSLSNGEVYLSLQYQGDMKGIVHFPASCLISGNPCPQPEFLTDLPAGLQSPTFAWSPDYQQMAFPVSDLEEQVWRFDRDSQTWTPLDMPYINGVVWSPDGQWIVGQSVTSGNQESNPLLVANTNGDDWFEIMADHSGFESPLAWLDDARILIINNLDVDTSEEDGTVYDEIQVYNTVSRETDAVAGISWDVYASNLSWSVSLDGSQFIYSLGERNTNASTVTWINLTDYSQTSFNLPVSIWAISWSPNGEWLALTDYIGNSCELYLVHPDGSDLHQVFTGESQGVCFGTWNPDGQYLLVPALTQTPSIPRLYVINVATGESRLVELPDVGVAFEWPVVSWVP